MQIIWSKNQAAEPGKIGGGPRETPLSCGDEEGAKLSCAQQRCARLRASTTWTAGTTSITSLEIEEYFWEETGRRHLLVSPLDWAIMETWQRAGVPLEAVLKGIDARVRELSTLATGSGKTAEEPGVLHGCGAASHGRGAGSSGGQRTKEWTRSEEAFPREELKAYLARNAARVAAAAKRDERRHPEMTARLAEIAESVRASSLHWIPQRKLDLEDLERR